MRQKTFKKQEDVDVGAVTVRAATVVSDVQIANRSISNIDRHYNFAAEQVASMAKWLTASLLAINGAGVLSALDALKQGHSTTLPSGFYIGGIVLALLSGAGLQEIYNRHSNNMMNSYNYWTSIKDGAARNVKAENSFASVGAFWNRWALLPPLLGWFSGLSFVAGCTLMALGITKLPLIP